MLQTRGRRAIPVPTCDVIFSENWKVQTVCASVELTVTVWLYVKGEGWWSGTGRAGLLYRARQIVEIWRDKRCPSR